MTTLETMTYREAVTAALADEMRADDSVILFGEDVAAAGGVFKTTPGLLDEFGAARVRDTPISENALVGMAVGAALRGSRPVVEIMFADFLANCFDQLVNHAAKWRFMSGGTVAVPMTVRAAQGGGISFAAQHSQSVESWLTPFPGLKIISPASPQDAYTMLRLAIRDPDPVVVLEHKLLYGRRGPVERTVAGDSLGTARVVREGHDATLVGLSGSVETVVSAAEALATRGISCEVIDLRSVIPLDAARVAESVRKTGRLVFVEDAPRQGGWAGQALGVLIDNIWGSLTARPLVLSGLRSPVPFSPDLEPAVTVSPAAVVAAVESLVGGKR